jgi:hypothetical protein
MAIEIQPLTISVAGAQLTPSGKSFTQGIFANEAFTAIHGAFTDVTSGLVSWKTIDVSNPLSPVVSNWVLTDTSFLGSDLEVNAYSNSHENMFYFDETAGFVYCLFRDSGEFHLCRITLATGLVEYSNALFKFASTFAVGSPVRGIAVSGGYLFVLHHETATNLTKLSRWSLSLATTWTTDHSVDLEIVSTHSVVVKYAAQPEVTGMALADDGNLLVFVDSNNVCYKYASINLSFFGITSFAGAGVGVLFNRNGLIYTTNSSLETTTDGLIINEWQDKSTGFASQEKSIINIPDRRVLVGENATVEVTFQIRDGFGAPMTSLVGDLCRFSIVTSRGVIDGDDAALGTSTGSVFRDGNGVPTTRQLDVAFDSTATAKVYFQSARRSTSQSIRDRLRIVYPAQ